MKDRREDVRRDEMVYRKRLLVVEDAQEMHLKLDLDQMEER